jgi:hemolysin III
MSRRPQSRPEEIANSVIHGFALLASVAGLPALVMAASGHRDPLHTTGAVIYGITLVLMYLSSTLYHAVPRPEAKSVLRKVDHSAIYLLIAGTYTPFMLSVLRGPVGYAILAAIWALAVFGTVAKLTIGFRYPRLSLALYLGMGWMIVFALQPLATHVSSAGIAWLVAGGLCYTGGVIFYVTDARLRFGHAIWHCFVAAGSACHFFAVLWHSIPRAS